jgi:hypothetical protein
MKHLALLTHVNSNRITLILNPEAARRPPASRKWWFLQFLWLFAQEIHEPLVVYGHINVAHQYYATVRHHVMMAVWLRGKQSFKPRAHAR